MSRKRQVSFPLRREHDVHFESLASLYAVARQNLSCIIIRRPSSEDAADCEAATRQVRPYEGSDLRESGESDLERFEEDASPAPRAAECARFFPLLLRAGIIGGKGESACVTGGRCGARQDEDAAYCGCTGPPRPAITTWPAGAVFDNLVV